MKKLFYSLFQSLYFLLVVCLQLQQQPMPKDTVKTEMSVNVLAMVREMAWVKGKAI